MGSWTSEVRQKTDFIDCFISPGQKSYIYTLYISDAITNKFKGLQMTSEALKFVKNMEFYKTLALNEILPLEEVIEKYTEAFGRMTQFKTLMKKQLKAMVDVGLGKTVYTLPDARLDKCKYVAQITDKSDRVKVLRNTSNKRIPAESNKVPGGITSYPVGHVMLLP